MRRTLVLASASPRRLALLREAGYDPIVAASDIDDALLRRGSASPEEFVVALSWFKARRVTDRGAHANAVVLAADTECLDGDELLGKPRDAAHARDMIRSLQGRTHRTATGVTVVAPGGARHLLVHVARVTIGRLDDRAIDDYVRSGDWRGKAGGYNYGERMAAGWPLACEGDPTGVMGLPMRRVAPLLERLEVDRREVMA